MGLAIKDLANQSSEQWQELWMLTSQLQTILPEDLVSSLGGDRGDDGVMKMPWLSYHPVVNRIEGLLYDLNVVQNVDWIRWKREIKPELVSDIERILSGSLYDTICCLTGIVRSERYGTGEVATTLRNGVFLALLERLRNLVTTENKNG